MHKELVFLKGYAKGKGYWKLLEAINTAIALHEGQKRKSGEDYIEHCMRVTSTLVALGLDDEHLLTVAIMHDVYEDCDVSVDELSYKYNLDKEVIEDIKALSKYKGMPIDAYYDNVRSHGIRTILVKLSDRCHNISSMVGAFSPQKMKEYVNETEAYVLPLCKYAKTHFPQYSDQIFVLKYFIESVDKAIKALVEKLDTD